MGIVAGPIKFTGSLGEYSCYINRDGKTIIRRKGGPSRKMFLTSPKLALSRQNSAEFGSASAVAGQIRRMFGQHMTYFSEGSYFSRLMGLIHEIAKFDPESMRGERQVFNGNVYLLEGFQWNKKLSFSQALNAERSHFIDPVSGKVQVQFSSFVPLAAMKAPAGATHFQVIAKAGSVYNGGSGNQAVLKASKIFSIDGKETGTIDLELDANLLKTGQDGLVMAGAGVIFYEEEMGALLPLRGGAFELMGVERTIPYEEPIVIDKETGEVKDRTEEIAAAKEVKRARRAEAVKRQSEVIEQFGYRMIRGIYPIGIDQKELEEMAVARKKLEHRLWVRKLERYRGV